jgi:hypothetical protein
VAELFDPEGHDLHETERARRRNREAIEIALDIDHREDELGRQLGARRLLVHSFEDIEPLIHIGHLLRQAPRHIGEPDFSRESIIEALGFRDGLQQHRA